MRTRNILTLAATILFMVSCQKEVATTSPALTNAQGVKTTSTIRGVTASQHGVPYPTITSSSGMASDDIGWHIDLGSVTSGVSGSTPKSSTISNLGDASLYCGGINTVNLLAGQTILMGTLQFANDAQNLYVTYTVNPDWYMTDVHLYVGALTSTPVSGAGTPSPGRFPISTTFTANSLSHTITYTIPLTSIPLSGFIIAAHAAVIRVDVDGDIVDKQTAWAAGTRFNTSKNWSTYVVGTLGYCGTGPADITNSNNNK